MTNLNEINITDKEGNILDKDLVLSKLLLELVNRVEVIDDEGRSYTNRTIKPVEISLQDFGKTLKIFC